LAALGNRPLYHLGLNADGSPRHPMARGRHRMRADARLRLWDPGEIALYLTGLFEKDAAKHRRPASRPAYDLPPARPLRDPSEVQDSEPA
jgi:hypothetical protein